MTVQSIVGKGVASAWTQKADWPIRHRTPLISETKSTPPKTKVKQTA